MKCTERKRGLGMTSEEFAGTTISIFEICVIDDMSLDHVHPLGFSDSLMIVKLQLMFDSRSGLTRVLAHVCCVVLRVRYTRAPTLFCINGPVGLYT